MKNKKGISLIVLVITIIVMIVLAGAVIITLDNSGIIGKANEAVINSNLKQVEQLASLAWAEAYLDENIKTDEQYKEYVENKLIANNIKLENYYIEITASGVKVEGPDTEKPTITIVSDKQSIKVGETITFTVTFSDNKGIATENLTANDITLNGFTATKEIYGEGNTRTITLSNVQGEPGEKSIAIAAGVATDITGNISDIISAKFEMQVITLGSLITSAEDYGKKINYVSDNGVTDWKVFYKQTVGTEEYVYLIASEKLAYDKVPTVLQTSYGATTSEATVTLGTDDTRTVGQIYWSSSSKVPTNAATIQNPTLWMAEWGKYDSYSTNINGRCVSYFLDENIWSDFANKEGYKDANGNSYVVGAIGTPTAEMFVASWNAIREATGNTSKYNKKLKLEQNGTIGYYVNNITNGEATSNAYSQSISTSDNLYIWSTESNSSVWLASPSVNRPASLLYVGNGGSVGYNYYDSTYYGVRPVVCLRSDIPATTDADGNYVI